MYVSAHIADNLRSTARTIRKLIPQLAGENATEVRVELSECGINALRDFADGMGWSRQDLLMLLREEAARCKELDLSASMEGLRGYYRVCRTGSHYLLSRAARTAVFAQLVGRRALR